MQNNRIPFEEEAGPRITRPSLDDGDSRKRYVWRLKANERGSFLCYSPQPWGIGVHFDAGSKRSEGHYEPAEDCPGCARALARKELYYVYGQDTVGKLVFLELPDGAAKVMKRLVPAGMTMRGRYFTLSRGKTGNARVTPIMLERFEHPEALPRDEDPLHTLEILWADKRPHGWPFRELCRPKPGLVLNGATSSYS